MTLLLIKVKVRSFALCYFRPKRMNEWWVILLPSQPTETPSPKTRLQVQKYYRLQLQVLVDYETIRQFYSPLSLPVDPISPP